MFELGGMSEVRREVEDILVQNKRRSLQDVDFSEYAESPRKTMGRSKIAEDVRRKIPSEKDVDEMEDEEFDDEGVDAGTDSSLEEGHLDYQVNIFFLFHTLVTSDKNFSLHYHRFISDALLFNLKHSIKVSIIASSCTCFLEQAVKWYSIVKKRLLASHSDIILVHHGNECPTS
jgi:hypothetical protein